MTRVAIAIGVVVSLLAAVPAAGQVSSVPRHIGQARYVYPEGKNPIAELTRLQKIGNWQALQIYARQLLGYMSAEICVKGKPKATPEEQAKVPPCLKDLLGDTDTNYYNLVWEIEGSDGKPAVARVLVQAQLRGEHAARIPGIDTTWETPAPEAGQTSVAAEGEPQKMPIVDEAGPDLLDVFLTDAVNASLSSAYVFTPTLDPLLTQLPEVVARLGVLGFLAKTDGIAGSKSASILVYVNQPNMLMSRAKIQIRDVVSIRLSPTSFKNDVTKTYDSVLLRQARTSACARSLASDLKAALDAAADTQDCKEANAKCSPALKLAVDSAYAAKAKSAVCQTETLANVGFDPLVATEAEFRKLIVAGGSKTVTGDSALTNLPQTRFSFGVLTGLLIGHPSLKHERVKIEGEKIVHAPLERSMTMVLLNVHPTGYDSEWPRVSNAERFRLFAGGVLTPDFGVSAGFGVGIVRGLSINFGAAWLLAETLKDGDKLGEKPKDGNDPFKTRVGAVGFAGFSYAFK